MCDWSSIIFSAQWAVFVLHVLIDLMGITLFCFVCASELRMKLRAGYLHVHRRRHAHVKFQASIDLIIIWITYSHAKPQFEHVIYVNCLFTK